MKTKIILFGLALYAANLFSQGNRPPGPQPCEEFPANIDSTLSFMWNLAESSWDLYNIRHYTYDAKKLKVFRNIKPLSRDTIAYWEYYYDENGNRNLEVYYPWSENSNLPFQKKESEYINGNQRINELTSNLVNGIWTWRAYQYFEWTDGKVTKSVYQLKDKFGVIYDFTHTFYYYENDFLNEVITKRGSDGYVTKITKYFRNDSDLVSEVIFIEPVNNPVTNMVEYIETAKRFYTYDEFKLLKEVKSEIWKDNQWVDYAKETYFRRIDNATRVRICFNGNSQCIPKSNLLNFLNRGATLGACPLPAITQGETESSTPATGNLKSSESVAFYPNPATESINVFAGESYSRVELINSNGQTVRAFPLQNGDLTVIERNGLPSGIYFLRFVGQEEVKTEKVILR